MYKTTRIAEGNLNVKGFRVNKTKQKIALGKLAVQLLGKSLVYLNLPTKV